MFTEFRVPAMNLVGFCGSVKSFRGVEAKEMKDKGTLVFAGTELTIKGAPTVFPRREPNLTTAVKFPNTIRTK
jgi:hypothetical protein